MPVNKTFWILVCKSLVLCNLTQVAGLRELSYLKYSEILLG